MVRRPATGHSWTYPLRDSIVLTFGSRVEWAMRLLSRKWRWLSVANMMRREAVWIDVEAAVSPASVLVTCTFSFLTMCINPMDPSKSSSSPIFQWSLPRSPPSTWLPCSSLCPGRSQPMNFHWRIFALLFSFSLIFVGSPPVTQLYSPGEGLFLYHFGFFTTPSIEPSGTDHTEGCEATWASWALKCPHVATLNSSWRNVLAE